VVFKINGCKLSSDAGLEARLAADNSVQDAIHDVKLILKGDSLITIEAPVTPKDFPSGQHKATLFISGPGIAATTQRVTLKRKEPVTVPLTVAVIGLLLGFVAALLGAWTLATADGGAAQVHPLFLVMALGAAALAVIPVFVTSYVTPADWSPGVGPDIALALAAATAAAGASTAALLAKGIVKAVKKKRQRRKAKKAAAAAA
jgi:hypothetical protein